MFKAFESGIFSRLKQSQSEQSEESKQSRSDDKYTSLKLDNDLSTSSNAPRRRRQATQTSRYLYQKKRKKKKGTRLKTLNFKKMLLPIALAQVKARNNSENLLNEIKQIVYSLYQSKDITKNVYNNKIKSVQI